MSKEVILTGLRANSDLHLGNYLGAILPVVELQKKHAGQYQVNMFIPDLHSFTTPIDHDKLYQQTYDNIKVFVAAGLDINDPDTFVYRQSFIPAHSELTWIFSCFSYFGELRRMTQFKEKSQPATEEDKLKFTNSLGLEVPVEFIATAGLYLYPILMAADILLYDATWVPVGEDQRQHLELVRDIATRMNNRFGQLFVIPHEPAKQQQFIGRDNAVRIRSLRNPDKKMSKSVEDPSGTILLSDDPAEAGKKVMRAETDSLGSIHFDFEKQPGISNLLQILALLSGKPQAEVNDEWSGKSSYGELKQAVATAVELFLTDLQGKLANVSNEAFDAKLTQDEKAMNEVANSKLYKVQKAVGLRK